MAGGPATISKYVNNVRHNFGVFDAEFNRSQFGNAYLASMTIILKVQLAQHETTKGYVSDGENKVKVGKWPDDIWQKFKNVYQTEGQNFWDGRFGLEYDSSRLYSSIAIESKEEINDLERSFDYFDKNKILLDCKFQLKLVDSAAQAHKIIKVLYLKEKKFYRSSSDVYDSRDLEEVDNVAVEHGIGVVVKQKTFLHEIGHAIGLAHVGVNIGEADCIKSVDHNIAACYGETIKDQKNIMGKGMLLSRNEAAPWITAAAPYFEVVIWNVLRYVSGW